MIYKGLTRIQIFSKGEQPCRKLHVPRNHLLQCFALFGYRQAEIQDFLLKRKWLGEMSNWPLKDLAVCVSTGKSISLFLKGGQLLSWQDVLSIKYGHLGHINVAKFHLSQQRKFVVLMVIHVFEDVLGKKAYQTYNFMAAIAQDVAQIKELN